MRKTFSLSGSGPSPFVIALAIIASITVIGTFVISPFILTRRDTAENSIENHIEGAKDVHFKFTSNDGYVVEFITDSPKVVKKQQFKHVATVSKDGIILSIDNQPIEQK